MKKTSSTARSNITASRRRGRRAIEYGLLLIGCIVFVDALGLFGASKPSDGLGRRFPVYSYYDVVHLNYRLLRDHLKVG